MNLLYLTIIVVLFAMAVCDLSVGVAGSAVPFMSPGMGSKAAKFKVLIAVAAIGIFVGAATSNGMMDVARHGIMNPTRFTFADVICICLAVTATDIILMDVFNTLGLPTSTTVSMVFGLLGGSTAIALYNMGSMGGGYGDFIHTSKALQLIIAIFLSVAIAFVFGTLVMWLTRLIFTFDYKHHGRWFRPIFGGLSITSILFFMLIIGAKGSALVPQEAKDWIDAHTWEIVGGSFVVFAVLTLLLDMLKVNIFKIIVLFGTFSLAMAFAGNDLVNFIGVPLSGLEGFIDFTENGAGASASDYRMEVLAGESTNALFNGMKPFFLVGSGVIMMVALCLSKKARKVVENSNSLASQGESEEVFSSSKLARHLVRNVLNINHTVEKALPQGLRSRIEKRFNSDEAILAEGAGFDIVRASVNLVLAGLLIVVGTSMQLPLSTTYVAFMVGMGSGLADRAWGRETAVYRITGVITVVGGWFITAGAAFILSMVIASINHFLGVVGMVAVIACVVFILIRNNRQFKKKQEEDPVDVLFRKMVRTKDKKEVWTMLQEHVSTTQTGMLEMIRETYKNIIFGLIRENIKQLRQASHDIETFKDKWKRYRRKEIVGMRMIDYIQAVEKNTWFHLGSNSMSQNVYCLKRMLEPVLEHVDNNFNPLPEAESEKLVGLAAKVDAYLDRVHEKIASGNFDGSDEVLVDGNALKADIHEMRHSGQEHLREEEGNIRTDMLYLNVLQESQELISNCRHLLRAAQHFNN